MTALHLHLLLNHVPLLGLLFSVAILLYAILRNSREAAAIALIGILVSAAAAVPVYLSGEPGEELLDHRAPIAESAVEAHEESAEITLIVIMISGVLAAAALVLARRGRKSRAMLSVTLLVAFVALVLVARTATLGGKIRHTELAGAAPALPTAETEAHED